MNHPILWLLASMCWSVMTWSQSDTVVVLPEIAVAATQLRNQSLGTATQTWKAENLQNLAANSLADLLQSETNTYLKSYGLGSIATASIRGGSAGHTLVTWNGLPLLSPMLGLLDLSLLPLQAIQAVQFQKGGQSALWGSGAIGGVIQLEQQADFESKINIGTHTTLGSFGYAMQQAHIQLGNEHIQSHTYFTHQQATNNFDYLPAPNLPKRQQTNAAVQQQNFFQNFYWKINPKHQLAAHFWRQQSNRQVPPTKVQTKSLAYQTDAANRWMIHWKTIHNRLVWEAKVSLFEEQMRYFDEQINLATNNQFYTLQSEVNAYHAISSQQYLQLGIAQNYTAAQSNNYPETNTEQRYALFGQWKWQNDKWQIQAAFRQTIQDKNFIPLVPNLGVQFQAYEYLQMSFRVSRNYRLPTLNDRFWQPGGNINLEAESGWSQELSINLPFQKKTWFIQPSLTAFNRVIDNWILWSPLENQGFWSANNLAKVWSRGVESRLEWQYQQADYSVKIRTGYDYILSTNQVDIAVPRIAKGDQLIYTPIHQAFGQVSLDFRSVQVRYQHQFTGATQGINIPLTAYHIGNLRLQYRLRLQKDSGLFYLNINNIWNTNYEIVEYRPMPGRHFRLGCQFSFNHKNSL